jgi:molybdate transport system substrate-binding protein
MSAGFHPEEPMQIRERHRSGRSAILVALLALATAVASPGRASGKDEVLVSAAVSLKAALEDAKMAFETSHPGTTVILNTGASGALITQIEQGAAVDLFVSASPDEVDRLARAGKILPDSRTDLASNRLVVALAADAKPLTSFADLAGARFQRIAIGNPKTGPAGRYAREALTGLGLWDRLEPRLVHAENVRQVLDYVARGEVDAGLVYRTDIRLLPGKVVEGPEAPSGSHAPIRYQGVIPAEAPHAKRSRQLLEYLTSAEGQKILANHGFLPPDQP